MSERRPASKNFDISALAAAFLLVLGMFLPVFCPRPLNWILWSIDGLATLVGIAWFLRIRLGPSIVAAGQVEESAFPERIGTYRILRRIGKGHSSNVYLGEALDQSKTDPYAIKRLTTPDRQSIARLENELAQSKTIASSQVVNVLEIGQAEDGNHFSVMDFVEGESVKDILEADSPIDEKRIIDLLFKTCFALNAIHSLSLVHRDIKPANLVIRDDDTVCILDLGLVRGEGSAKEFEESSIAGTPCYLSPEAAAGNRITSKSDVYALGCLGYELIMGFPPHTANNAIEIVRKQMREKPNPITADHVSDKLASLIMRCLSKSPQDRPSARQMINLLSAL